MIDMTKKYMTCKGHAVELYAAAHGKIFGAYQNNYGEWYGTTWSTGGFCFDGLIQHKELDLVEAPKPRIKEEYWVNIRRGAYFADIHDSMARAFTHRPKDCIAALK